MDAIMFDLLLVAGSEQLKRLIKSICDADDRLEAGSTRRMHSLHAINYLLSNCCQADLPPDISIESIGQLTSRNHLISLMESWLVMESGKQLAVDSEQYKCKVISLLNAVHIVLLTMTGDLEAMQMANQCITQLVEQITSPDGELIVPFTNPSLSLSDILSLSQAVQSALEIAGYKSSPRLSQLLNGPQDAVKASVFPEMIVRRGWELCPVCDSDLAITSSNDFGLCEGRLIENGVKLIRHKIERCSLTLLAIDDYWLRGSCNGCGAVAQLPPIDSVQFSIETANACCDNIPFPNCTRCGGRFSHSDL
jgi:hypothetical protein